MMNHKYLETTHIRTGEAYYVVESLRGAYFRVVPKSNPAQSPITYLRSEFTKPVWKEVA